VLDNCEHVIEAAAALAVDTLRGAPGVRVLATSREPLRTANTCTVCHRWRALPQRGRGSQLPGRLFVERAAATMNEFELTNAHAAIVAEICEKLDGIPLAIGFAAPREPVAEHNDMVKAIPPDRTVPMPGKMARSATRPPFGLPEGAGSRPHLASVFQVPI
jgi:hypothetical protein